MVYDRITKRVGLFGGNGGTQSARVYFNDTWEWNGVAWSQSPVTGTLPGARCIHTMAYSVADSQVLLHGGYNNGCYSDTWELIRTGTTATWVSRVPYTGPGNRYGGSAAYDDSSGRCVFFGGHCGGNYHQTWEWIKSQWYLTAPVPHPQQRERAGMVYDSVRGRILMFGGWNTAGLNDTWEFYHPPGATYSSFGAGCAGASGAPALAPAYGLLPWIQSDFRLDLTKIPPNPLQNIPGLILGASNATWSGLDLPLDLGVFGMPSCKLYASPTIVLTQANSGGSAQFVIPVPLSLQLIGVRVFVQGLVIAPGANAGGVLWSNAGEAKIGAR